MQFSANNASDALVRWSEGQIDSNRWRIAGLFDGRLSSPLIAAGWLLTAYIANRLFLLWSPDGIIGWPIATVLAANLVLAALTFFLALFMFTPTWSMARRCPRAKPQPAFRPG